MAKKIFTLIFSLMINYVFANDLTRIGNNYFESNSESNINLNHKKRSTSFKTKASPNNLQNANLSNSSEDEQGSGSNFLRIGSSYFKKSQTPNATHPAYRQVGIDYEQRQGATWVYPFVDYLSTNNFYYEIRGYFVYNYVSQNSPIPTVPVSSENSVIGGGIRGFFGYLIPITAKFTILPAVSLWYMTNALYEYNDILGNSISSNSYLTTLTAKLEFEINENIAVYFVYGLGYQFTSLGGTGKYSNANNPSVSGLFSAIEIGLPYNVSKSWSITPYTQFSTSFSQPNPAASDPIWNVNQLTTSALAYGIRAIFTW